MREYKASANEFRNTINDYRTNTISKAEHQSLEKILDFHSEQIKALQIEQGRGEGSTTSSRGSRLQTNFLIGLIVTSVLSLLSMLFMAIHLWKG